MGPQPQLPVRSTAAGRGPTCLCVLAVLSHWGRQPWEVQPWCKCEDGFQATAAGPSVGHTPMVESWEVHLRGRHSDVLDGSCMWKSSERALHVYHVLLL